jgi:hypothetical protein
VKREKQRNEECYDDECKTNHDRYTRINKEKCDEKRKETYRTCRIKKREMMTRKLEEIQ